MKQNPSWKECLEKRIVKSVPKNNEQVKQLLKMANIRLEFWEKQTNERYISLKVEGLYEAIKELISALMLQQGYSCSNHLCLISFLRENFKNIKYEIEKIDELRQLRNEITKTRCSTLSPP